MIRYLVVAAVCLAAAPAFAQEHQVVPALNRCGAQLGQLAAQNYSLAEELDRLTAERDALKKELAVLKKPAENKP